MFLQDELRIAWQYRRYLSEQKPLEEGRLRQQELIASSWAPSTSSFNHATGGNLTNTMNRSDLFLVYSIVNFELHCEDSVQLNTVALQWNHSLLDWFTSALWMSVVPILLISVIVLHNLKICCGLYINILLIRLVPHSQRRLKTRIMYT